MDSRAQNTGRRGGNGGSRFSPFRVFAEDERSAGIVGVQVDKLKEIAKPSGEDEEVK